MAQVTVDGQTFDIPEPVTGAAMKRAAGAAPTDLLYAAGPTGDRVLEDTTPVQLAPGERAGVVRAFTTGGYGDGQ